jgi:sugar lactone lactonase YvrE
MAGCGGGSNISGTAGCSSCATKTTNYVAIADENNQRLLIFDEPISTGQSASIVLGAASFTQEGFGFGQNGMWQPSGVAVDPSGNLSVTDVNDNRVLQFTPPFSDGMNASIVIGQSDFSSLDSSSSASGLDSPIGVASDAGGNLWVADGSSNSRVLEFKPPFSSGMAASVVIGQTSINTTQGCNLGGVPALAGAPGSDNPSATTLCGPQAIAFDAGGNLWIADGLNNRVLEYAPPFSTGMAATWELGHAAGASAFSTYQSNDGGSISASALSNPSGIAFDAHGNLWVTDGGNNRVLEFAPPFSNGMAAALVLGQPDFTHNSSQATQSGFGLPVGVAFDTNGSLLVTTDGGSGVRVFTPPFSNGMNASVVFGQQSFSSNECFLTANSMCAPLGVATF